ncbi:MAG: thiamine pyrophosphate-binding protein [Geminicoccaceae bacterium]
MLVFLGGNASALSVRPNFTAARNYEGWVKRVEAIYTPDQVGDVMRRAFHALRNGTPGPVVVELTADVCAREVPEAARTYKSPKLVRQQPASAEIEAAADALIGAKQGLIWAGAGVLFAGATTAFRSSPSSPPPVFCTMPGKSAFDERHPLALGAGSGTTTGPAHQWLTQSDVLLALGSSLTRTPYGRGPPRQGLIHNTVNPDDLNKDEAADIGLVGDTPDHRGPDRLHQSQDRRQGLRRPRRHRSRHRRKPGPHGWPNGTRSSPPTRILLPRDPGPQRHARPREQHRHPRRGSPRDVIVPALLHGHHRTAMSAGARPPIWASASPRHRREDGGAEEVLPQPHGRRRLRHVRHRHRNRRPLRRRHHHRPPQQQRHGHLLSPAGRHRR